MKPSDRDILVTVHTPFDLDEQRYVEALLEEADISYAAKNEGVQDVLGIGRIGGTNVLTGGVEIQVRLADVARAQEILSGLELEAQPLEGAGCERTAESEAPADHWDPRAERLGRVGMFWAILWLGGVGSFLGVVFGLRSFAIPNASRSARFKAAFALVVGLAGLVFWFLMWGQPWIERHG